MDLCTSESVGTTARAMPVRDRREVRPPEREATLGDFARQQRLIQAGLLVSTVSHEVRNSLQVVYGALDVGLGSEDPADWKEALEVIRETAGSLAETSDAFAGLLARGDAEARRLFPISELVARAVRLVDPLAFDREVRLESSCGVDGYVRGDFHLAVQALLVLASNAIRACPSGWGRVRISASRPAEDVCRIEIEDNGAPPSSSLNRRLDRPFATDPDEESGREFGLLLVREAADALRGSVSLRSAGSRTTFVLDLPCSPVAS